MSGRRVESLLLWWNPKPEIYTTADGKMTEEDELLEFWVIKMKTAVQHKLVLLAMNHFSEWIAGSKKVLGGWGVLI